MKLLFCGALVAIGVCCPISTIQAQSYWVLTYQGTITSTNGSGKIVTVPMTDRTLIQQCAQAGGATDTRALALTYHFHGTGIGDTLEVVNTNDPSLFSSQIFQMAFPQSYTNVSGTFVRTFSYIYNNESAIFNDPSAHSRGSAVVTIQSSGKNGGTNTVINGNVQFWLGVWLDSSPATNVSTCAGTFTSKFPLNIP